MSPSRTRRGFRIGVWAGLSIAVLIGPSLTNARGAISREEVERAIQNGVRYLKSQQSRNGSWPDISEIAKTGTTSLVTLALLTAGEKPDEPHVKRALEYLRGFSAEDLQKTYSVALQTMVFAAAEPEKDLLRITANAAWLERAQIKQADRTEWTGSWTYSMAKRERGDNSNTQYALLGLNAASEAGVPIDPKVWALARAYWEEHQLGDGGWSYRPDTKQSTASMTSAGISSLVITGIRRYQGEEYLEGDTIHNCGKGGTNPRLNRGIDWMARHFFVGKNFGMEQIWKFYYLYGLERAGRLAGLRFFGQFDWYRLGAEEIVHNQKPLTGFWEGVGGEKDPLVATSFAVLFLSKGRAPVLVNKLRHLPGTDWNSDADDMRNLVSIISRDWKTLMTWQVVDPGSASIQDMLQAPIAFITGHSAPNFNEAAVTNLREFVNQGGFIMADACCSKKEFDEGFKVLMKRVFPEEEFSLKPLTEEHPVWRAKHLLTPDVHPLWGIEQGCRTVVIYSPVDLSCYWNQSEHSPSNTAVIRSIKVGQNIVDYATGRELPADKLTVREVRDFKAEKPKPGTLRIAKLRHAGDWNIAPKAIPNLMETLRNPPLGYDVVRSQKELFPQDQNLVYYPLIYIHGRAAVSFSKEDIEALRKHIDPGAGTLFADAACGSPSFDASFRRFVSELFPTKPLVPIPKDDELYTEKIGFNLATSEYTKAAGGGKDYPLLEGIQVDGHWAVIYSKNDIGCALERNQALDCKGYTHESALKIAANIVIYSTLP